MKNKKPGILDGMQFMLCSYLDKIHYFYTRESQFESIVARKTTNSNAIEYKLRCRAYDTFRMKKVRFFQIMFKTQIARNLDILQSVIQAPVDLDRTDNVSFQIFWCSDNYILFDKKNQIIFFVDDNGVKIVIDARDFAKLELNKLNKGDSVTETYDFTCVDDKYLSLVVYSKTQISKNLYLKHYLYMLNKVIS